MSGVPQPFEPGASRLLLGAGQWVAVDVPDSTNMIYVVLVGPGGNGGAGRSGAAASARGGGAGGGTGAITRSFFPTVFLPSRKLFLYLPARGSAENAYASTIPSAASTTYVLMEAQNGNSGATGPTTGFAVAATGGLAMGSTAGQPVGLTTWLSSIGRAGANGGNASGQLGPSLNYTGGSTGMPVTGGAGGGGVTGSDFGGGSVTGSHPAPTIAGAAAGSNRGADGSFNFAGMWFSLGGGGGGASNSGLGGDGGDGGPGAGGGGGGGGTTGGAGGKGGPGFALVSWS